MTVVVSGDELRDLAVEAIDRGRFAPARDDLLHDADTDSHAADKCDDAEADVRESQPISRWIIHRRNSSFRCAVVHGCGRAGNKGVTGVIVRIVAGFPTRESGKTTGPSRMGSVASLMGSVGSFSGVVSLMRMELVASSRNFIVSESWGCWPGR